MALMLAGCAAEPFAAQAPAPSAGMAGRWMLTAPNAPSCGMDFEGEPRRAAKAPSSRKAAARAISS